FRQCRLAITETVAGAAVVGLACGASLLFSSNWIYEAMICTTAGFLSTPVLCPRLLKDKADLWRWGCAAAMNLMVAAAAAEFALLAFDAIHASVRTSVMADTAHATL